MDHAKGKCPVPSREGNARQRRLTGVQFGIGQSARLIQSPNGNILWDLVAYLDEDTIDKIQALGGIKMIVISHPHFYTFVSPPATVTPQPC